MKARPDLDSQTVGVLCNLASFDGDLLEQTIWEWIKRLLRDPQAIMDGLNAVQDEGRKANKILYDRLDILDSQIKDIGGQLSRVLDLYITGDFSKELLVERKSRLEKTLADMQKERMELSSHIQTITIGDEQRQRIEAFCVQVDQGLETATYEDKLAIVEMLDVRGTIAIENNSEKVVYIKCILEQQQHVPVLISPSSNEHSVTAITIMARLVLALCEGKPKTLANNSLASVKIGQVEME